MAKIAEDIKTDIQIYKSLFENVGELCPDVIYMLSKTGRINYLSPSFEKVTGWKSQKWIGKHFRTLVHPHDLPKALTHFMYNLAGKPSSPYILRIKSKNEGYLLIEFNSTFIKKNGQVAGTVGFAKNLTKEIKTDERKKSLAEASKLLSSSLDYEKTLGSAAKLIVPRLANWCTIYLLEDNKLKKIVTKTSHSKLNKDLEKIISTQKNIEKNMKFGSYHVIKTKEPQLYKNLTPQLIKEMTGIKEFGKLVKKYNIKSAIAVPIISRKKVLGTITFASFQTTYEENDLEFAIEIGKRAGHAIDNSQLYKNAQEEIEARKLITKELEQSKEQLEVIIENIADGITVQNNKGELILANKAAAEISGYSSAEKMIEKPNQWLKNFKLRDRNEKPYNLKNLPEKRALKKALPQEDLIHLIDKKGQKENWLHIKAMPVYTSNGKIRMVVNIIRDVTEAKIIEKQKDIFISMASHELRTPLTSVKLYSQALKGKMEKNKDLKPLFENMNLQLNKINILIEDLLNVSRMKTGKLEIRKRRFNFDKFIRTLVNNLQIVKKTHKFKLDSNYKGMVSADKDRIEQVLVNFITNAIKYSPIESTIHIKSVKVGDKLVVSVKDVGSGIAKKHQEKIFEQFYRVDNNHTATSGLGLGLFISKKIIEKHKGKIWLKSKPREGSTFYFSLPIKSELPENNNLYINS